MFGTSESDHELAWAQVLYRIEKYENYALAYDNVMKMIAIYFRVKSGIPVVSSLVVNASRDVGCGYEWKSSFLSRIASFVTSGN